MRIIDFPCKNEKICQKLKQTGNHVFREFISNVDEWKDDLKCPDGTVLYTEIRNKISSIVTNLND